MSKLTLFVHLSDLCLDLGIRKNEHPTGKFGSAFQLSFFFPLSDLTQKCVIAHPVFPNFELFFFVRKNFKTFKGILSWIALSGKFILNGIIRTNPIQDGPFRGCSRIGATKRPTLPKICHTYRKMMKRGTVIPYLKKIQKIICESIKKIYESRDTPLPFCWNQHF